jgi:hypothetical protein
MKLIDANGGYRHLMVVSYTHARKSEGRITGADAPTWFGGLSEPLLLAVRGRLSPMLLPIPVLWCLPSGLTPQTMGELQAWVPYASFALATAAWIWKIIRQRGRPMS